MDSNSGQRQRLLQSKGCNCWPEHTQTHNGSSAEGGTVQPAAELGPDCHQAAASLSSDACGGTHTRTHLCSCHCQRADAAADVQHHRALQQRGGHLQSPSPGSLVWCVLQHRQVCIRAVPVAARHVNVAAAQYRRDLLLSLSAAALAADCSLTQPVAAPVVPLITASRCCQSLRQRPHASQPSQPVNPT